MKINLGQYEHKEDGLGRFQTSDGTLYERGISGVIRRIGAGKPRELAKRPPDFFRRPQKRPDTV